VEEGEVNSDDKLRATILIGLVMTIAAMIAFVSVKSMEHWSDRWKLCLEKNNAEICSVALRMNSG
jgi:hypothetical protein